MREQRQWPLTPSERNNRLLRGMRLTYPSNAAD